MADPKEAQQKWAQQFLYEADLQPIVGQLMLAEKYTPEAAKKLATFAANIRFQSACLDNVQQGYMLLTLDATGSPTFMLTEAGVAQAEKERPYMTTLEDGDDVPVASLARYAVAPDRED